jgi:hypothetical protein
MALVADEPPPELEKTLNVGGLGFQLTNNEKRQFKISPASADRIVQTMKMRGYITGDWDIAKVTPASSATEYIFTFDPAGVKNKPHIFRLQYKYNELHAVIELADLEASRLPDEAGMSVYDLANKRMRKFVLAVENSRGGYGMRAPPVPAGAPAGPVAAGAPPAAAGAPEDSVLANLMGKMGVREGGRRRRTKKQKRMRRRATKKKLFT